MKAAIHCLLALVFWLPLTAAATEVYRWTDENGVLSYGERPPENVAYIKVKIYGAASGNKTGSYYAPPSADSKAAGDNGSAETDKPETKKTTP